MFFGYNSETDKFHIYYPTNKFMNFFKRHPDILKEYIVKEFNLKDFKEFYEDTLHD